MQKVNDRIVRVVRVSFEPEHYERILEIARDLNLSIESVLRAVCSTAVRRHFDSFVVAPSDEVSSDA